MARIRKSNFVPVDQLVFGDTISDPISHPSTETNINIPSRIPNDGGITGSGRVPGSESRSNNESTVQGSEIARQIINSPTYQNALKIFNSESDKQWLNRLELIPFSVMDAPSSIFDNFLSNNQADKTFASYQFAMEQITNLVSEYYQYKNTLPVTQVQQFADAGINSAITGQGVSGSSINPQSASTNPSSISSTNTGEILSVASNFILDSVNGLSAVAKGFRELGIAESNQLLDFNKFLREQGISFMPEKSYKSFASLLKGIKNGDSYILSDPKGEQIRFETLLKRLMTEDRFAPVMQRFVEMDQDGFPRFKEFDGEFGLDFNSTYTGMVGVRAVTEAQYQSLVLDLERQLMQNKYSLSLSDKSLDKADLEIKSSEFNKDLSDIELKKANVYFDLINNLHKSDDPVDHYLLCKILTGFNPDDISILSSQADFANTERAMGIIGQILRLLSGH